MKSSSSSGTEEKEREGVEKADIGALRRTGVVAMVLVFGAAIMSVLSTPFKTFSGSTFSFDSTDDDIMLLLLLSFADCPC